MIEYEIIEALQVDNKPMYLLRVKDRTDYDSHILYSNSLEVLEDEMRKLTLKQSGIEQLQLF